MNGPHDSDILALVHSSWDDLTLLADLPVLLAAEMVRHGVSQQSAEAALGAAREVWPSRERVVALLAAATPGVWQADGSANVVGTVDDLDVSGHFSIVAGDDRTLVATVTAVSIDDLASVQLIVEGVPLLRQLAAVPTS